MSDRSSDIRNGLVATLYAALVVLFLLGPIVIAVIVGFSSGSRLEFPIPGVSLRWFREALSNIHYQQGLWNSLVIGLGNAVIATVVGTCAALALNRYVFTGRAIMQVMMMLPLAMPGIILGLGLLFTLAAYHMNAGLPVATLGHAVIGVPYVVAMVTASLANYDRSLERASMSLGVGPVGTFFKVTLPLIKSGIIAGAISSFLISFDNFSLSLFITRGDTLPLRLMQQLMSYADPSIAAISTLLVILSLVLLIFLLPVASRSK